jgi:DNA-binding MarR family transcriptional regulator
MKEALGPLACHCFATRQLARHISRLYERHLAPARITSAQFSILSFLQEKPGLTMSDLSSIMVMDRTTLLRAIKPLQRDGFVVSAPKQGDTRQLAFTVSPAGFRKIEETGPLWQAAQQEYEARIGTELAARLREDFLTLTQEA